MLLRVLGSVEVVDGATAVRSGGRKERALLAALAVHANEVVSEDALVDAIWCGVPPPSALPTLRSYVSRLRRALEGDGDLVVETRPPGYRLRVRADCLDAAIAEQLLAKARDDIAAASHAPAVERLRLASSLWLGPSLGEFALEPFALAEAARLDEMRVVIAEERLGAEMALGRHREALPDLEAISVANPLRERLWGLWVLALYQSGSQGEALRVYQQLRQHLGSELGLEPTPRLRAIEAAVLAQAPELDWSPPAPRGPDRRRRLSDRTAGLGAHPSGERPAARTPATNVPVRLSSFVGRTCERAEVARLLGAKRLITLVGSPGVGKTRLALAVAADVLPGQSDGAWLVELAPVAQPSLISQTVASALSVRERPGVDLVATLVAELADRHLLLVLDNCEHLVEGCGRLAERLLEACSGLRILATSRQPLGVQGECVRRIEPLDVPPRAVEAYDALLGCDSVRLFAERAADTQAGWVMTEAAAATIAEICRRLEGIPLAIELAAARLELLSLPEVVGQLDSLFRLLRSPTRSAPAFHSSLLATLDWSHDLLSGPEAAVLRRLSVFAGGCSLPAAETVCAGGGVESDDVMELIAALVRKSLVSTDCTHAETRYRLLDSIRDYAAGKLTAVGERAAVCAAHCSWAVALAEQVEIELEGGTPTGRLERIEAERDNFRAANEWAIAEGRTEIPLRLGAALSDFWWLQGHVREGRQLLQAALVSGQGDSARLRARALAGLAFIIGSGGEVSEALQLARESLAVAQACRDDRARRKAQQLIGVFSLYRSPVGSLSRLEADVDEARREGDLRALGLRLSTLGSALLLIGDARAARLRHGESLEIAHAIGNRSLAAAAVGALGQAAVCLGEYAEGERLLRQALAEASEIGERGIGAATQSWLGDLARKQGRYDAARAALDEALKLATDVGRPFLVARCLCFYGWLALDQGEFAAARRHLTESCSMADALGLTYLIARCQLGLAEVELCEGGPLPLARAALDEALAVAEREGDRHAVACATSAMARVAARGGALGEARTLAGQAVRLQEAIGDAPGLVGTLETVASLLDPAPDAVRLLEAAAALRSAGCYARPPRDRDEHERRVASARSRLAEAEVAMAGADGRNLTIPEASALAAAALARA